MKPGCPGRGQDAQRGLPERLCEAGEAVRLLLNVTRRAECSCHRWPLARCSKSCQLTGPRPRTEAQLPAALCPAGPSVPSPGNPLSCLLRALLRRGNGSSCLRGPTSRVRPSLGSLPCTDDGRVGGLQSGAISATATQHRCACGDLLGHQPRGPASGRSSPQHRAVPVLVPGAACRPLQVAVS